MNNVIGTDDEFVFPDFPNDESGDEKINALEAEMLIDTKNEVHQLRKLLDSVVMGGMHEESTTEMLRWVEMAIELSTTIKYLQNPETINLDLGFDLEDDECDEDIDNDD